MGELSELLGRLENQAKELRYRNMPHMQSVEARQ